MAEDKKTIGLTDANKVIMDKLVESAGFAHDMDAAKFAFALAVNRSADVVPVEGVGTIWNVGSFDQGGDIKALVQNLFPDTETPYRLLENLMNAGFALIDSEMKNTTDFQLEYFLEKEAKKSV